MATTPIYPSEATIKVCAASILASGTGTSMTTYLSNMSLSGGSQDFESVPLFGNTSLQKFSPREPVEVSFDFVTPYEQSVLFAQLLMGSATDGSSTAAESKDKGVDKAIYIQSIGTTGSQTIALNNARCTTLEMSEAADGYQTGTVTFKCAPTDSAGKSNFKVHAQAMTHSSVTWA